MQSTNQINAYCKLLEMWKASNIINYPIKIYKLEENSEGSKTRAISRGDLQTCGYFKITTMSFLNADTRALNRTPNDIEQCKSLFSVKKAISY